MEIKIPGCTTHDLPARGYAGTMAGSASQAKWVTKKLEPGEFLMTSGLTACTGLALIDSETGVVSLAHFDSTQSEGDIKCMLGEMLKLGAAAHRIRAVISGNEDYNMSAMSVYNCLKDQEHWSKQVSAYRDKDQLVAYGNGTVCWFDD